MMYQQHWQRGKILHPVLVLPVRFDKYLGSLDVPSTGPDGNAEGMKRLYWGLDAYVVKCDHYLYKVSKEVYEKLKAEKVARR